MKRVTYDPSGCYLGSTGLTAASLQELAPRLEAAREEVLVKDAALYASGGPIPAEKNPLDAGFLDLPKRLLDEYNADRPSSQLYRILKTAHRLRDQVDDRL